MATQLRCEPVEEIIAMGGPAAAPAIIDEVVPWDQHGLRGAKVGLSLSVAMCVPFAGGRRWTPPEFALSLPMLQIPPNTNCVWLATKGVKRDQARTELVEMAIDQGARNVLFIDDDNPPPPDTLLKLLEQLEAADDDVAVCAGIYTTKYDPPQPLVFLGEGMGPFWKWKRGQVFECANIATGCMMIRTSTFARITRPWFVDITTPEEGRAAGIPVPAHALKFEMTDDMYFCRKVREAGMRILAHGGVLPGHWDQDGRCYFLPDDSYPMRP